MVTLNALCFVCVCARVCAQILKQNNTRLENRTQLVTMCHMGPKVFINCAGFIKIDTASLGDRCAASEQPYRSQPIALNLHHVTFLLRLFTPYTNEQARMG